MSSSSARNLEDVLRSIRSEKIKERQEGLSSIRTLFASDRVLERFIQQDGVPAPKLLLPVFQALFKCVLLEKADFTKKSSGKAATSSAAAQRRLSEAASTLRWLTERATHLLNRKVTDAIIIHLLSTIKTQKGELFTPIALDYVKALKGLVSYGPHLDHMEAGQWIEIVELGFNVVLGDPLRTAFVGDEQPPTPGPSASVLGETDSDWQDEGETDTDGQGGLGKRRRGGSVSPQKPKAKRRNRSVPTTLEQLEFNSVLALLVRSPSAPFLHSPHIVSSIFLRLQRFLDLYPPDASVYNDFLPTLSSTLSHVSLNRKDDVVRFTRKSWKDLVGLWGTKNRRLKETLVVVLHQLLPYVVASEGISVDEKPTVSYDWSDNVWKLWHLLSGEAESKWGVDGLSIETIRLQLSSYDDDDDLAEGSAFFAKTFRAGWNFDAAQALAWAILQLQADCANMLFRYSESPNRTAGKRQRLEDPVTSILNSIRSSSPPIRVYHLQVLLFFIDRHWYILHDTLQQHVMSILLQCIAHDDSMTRSWAFLCCAAVAHADGDDHALSSSQSSSLSDTPHSPRDSTTWDTIWTHAVRRANDPSVCRVACHAAHALLLYLNSTPNQSIRTSLASHRVLAEIENFAKDLDVQGPSHPHESVCAFLTQCLAVASQDARLYRKQLEDKVLTWLLESWKPSRPPDHAGNPPPMLTDVLLLLETICGLSKKSDLVCRLLLPDSLVVQTLIDESRCKIIRDFTLFAKLPDFKRAKESSRSSAHGDGAEGPHFVQKDVEPAPPKSRERKVSAFLLRVLEAHISDWEASQAANTRTRAERVQGSLSISVTALNFEAILFANGIASNRHVIQSSFKLISLVLPQMEDRRWTAAEKATMLLALEPLVATEERKSHDVPWVAMLPPDVWTGIRAQTLAGLVSDKKGRDERLRAARMHFLRIIWQNADVKDVFDNVMTTLRNAIRVLVGSPASDHRSSQAMDVDEKDGFGKVRSAADHQSQGTADFFEGSGYTRCIADVCVGFLANGPILQSASGEPTRDKELTELLLDCADEHPEKFLLVCPPWLDNVRRKSFSLSSSALNRFLDEMDSLLRRYAYSRREEMHRLIILLLQSTLHIWSGSQTLTDETACKVQELCHWLSGLVLESKISAWRARDSLAVFFDRYLAADPEQISWSASFEDDEVADLLPSALLPLMSSDKDIRVRFRIAPLIARLFLVAHQVGYPPLALYKTVLEQFPVDLFQYEHIITRLLSLGNIMMARSSVRRGAYWHVLETCYHHKAYSRHAQVVLLGVSRRMGLEGISALFEANVSQIAFTMLKDGLDVTNFPPHLLGYRNRRESAQASFRAFTPTNLLSVSITQGQKAFESHCAAVQKSAQDGIRECFGDIVAYQVLVWFNETEPEEEQPAELEAILLGKTLNTNSPAEFREMLQRKADQVAISMMRTLSDQDFSAQGPISSAIALRSNNAGSSVQSFLDLTQFRKPDDFEFHDPNLPAFDATTVLRALSWLHEVSKFNVKGVTYHVLHQLFADLEASPFVNEQIRLVNAISLWVACNNGIFDDSALLHTLLHGACSLMTQADLAPAAQSILDWSFNRYCRTASKDPRFPDILIRTCCLAYDYSRQKGNARVAHMGHDLLRWIDQHALNVSRAKTLREQVLIALPAWPHRLSPELAELFKDVTTERLSAALNDQRITSNKFRLVRRLCDQSVYDQSSFGRTDFWHLKDCIPIGEQLHDEDIHAFAEILVLNQGMISSFGNEQLLSAGSPVKQRQSKSEAERNAPPHVTIILSLLATLEQHDPDKLHVAYRTLRAIMSAPDIIGSFRWSSEHQAEIEYLRQYSLDPISCDVREIGELLNSEVFLEASGDFPRWVTMLTVLLTSLLSSSSHVYAQLEPILHSDAVFAESLLPVLVRNVLQSEDERAEPEKPCATVLSSYFSSVLSAEHTVVPCLRSIVDIVLHLRNFKPKSGGALAYNTWLNIDFMLLARKSISCGSYTTALLFLELASDFPWNNTAGQLTAEGIMYEIYSNIDEPDGFYGIQDQDHHQFLIKRFHHEKQWEKAFHFHGAALEAGSGSANETEGLLQSFHSFGFNHLASTTLKGLASETIASSSIAYHLGWRTETWDLPDREGDRSPGNALYLALRAQHRERDQHVIDDTVRCVLLQEMETLRSLGSENIKQIREVVQSLMCLSQVAQWKHSTLRSDIVSKVADISIDQWSQFADLQDGFDFLDAESIMATRISLVRSIRQKEERRQIAPSASPLTLALLNIEKRCLLRISGAARDAHQAQIALNSVIRAKTLETTPSLDVSEEFASVLWLHDEGKRAVQLLTSLRDQASAQSSSDVAQMATMNARLGTWTADARLEKPSHIMREFIRPAISLIEKAEPQERGTRQSDVFHQCAIFAERQYLMIVKSPDTAKWKTWANQKKEDIKAIEIRIAEIRRRNGTEDELKEFNSLRSKAAIQMADDEIKHRQYISERNGFLTLAIDMYSRCLQASDDYDADASIRLCSLWLANFDDDASLPHFPNKVQLALDRVPSRKFVFLAHQLSARLQSAKKSKNQPSLQNLLIRMCTEHPFHSLYQVFCLKTDKSSKSDTPSRTPSRSSSRTVSDPNTSPATQTDRGMAANDIFDRLRKDERTKKRVLLLEQLSIACLEWASLVISKKTYGKTGTSYSVPAGQLITKIRNISVPVITCHTPLDSTLGYKNCVWITKYESTFETAGGLNLPKISQCLGSDGQSYKQLFKGKDDSRQDAVMEQVFELVNNVLRQDKDTRKRSLQIRDYKIVPLASQAGVLEFVGHTTTLTSWLNIAHHRYKRPEEWYQDRVYKHYKKMITGDDDGHGKLSHERRQAEHIKIRKEKFRPVFRHFFTEYHKTPISWYAMRLNYTRSVATTSIVGHILGIGDRHSGNILVDTRTGEVVHIDFGFAFEQGKLLAYPETVPFRMTDDVVDGMGISGTDGVFQRCAEETLRVLRDGSEVIMTVLEVFKHDPLHNWTASEMKIQRAQLDNGTTMAQMSAKIDIGKNNPSSGSVGETAAAERALNGVASKLDKALSVTSTVSGLIAEAKDPANLCSLWPGWGAYL